MTHFVFWFVVVGKRNSVKYKAKKAHLHCFHCISSLE